MPQYQHPDVYVEYVPGTPPIAGVGTSTAAFIGVADVAANDMPLMPGSDTTRYPLAALNTPTLVTNWSQFKNNFGDILAANNTLAHAVYGFFINGGTAAYVVRVSALGTTEVTAALRTLEPIDEVALVAAPGVEDNTAAAVITHCELMGDRFAILDGHVTTTISVPSIKGTLGTSSYAAIYFPYIQVYDPVTEGNINLPPSGHMAGIYARVDATRGVH
ncbi:MAG: phage tail sheath family protein, partial [Anaerolineae bacterium]|nr:phage tail sheath family protein [Anaerolineae bacterium]